MADDMLAEWERVARPIKAHYASAAEGATSEQDLRDRLTAAAKTAPVEDLATLILRKRTAADLAGRVGTEL
jgi:hypothetical protein